MGKYDNILIAADYDGTFAWQSQIPKENLRALEHFYAEGGKFTLCTGRSPEDVINRVYLKMDGVYPNAPLICDSGALVQDAKTGARLVDMPILGDYREVVAKLAENKVVDHVNIVCDDDEHFRFTARNPEEMQLAFEKAMKKNAYKILFAHKPGKQMIPYGMKKIVGNNYHLFANAPDLFEINAKGTNKGKSALTLKKALGAKILIGCGDYNGDVDLLKVSDIAICPENANEKVKVFADQILCHAKDGLILDLFNHLDELLEARNIK